MRNPDTVESRIWDKLNEKILDIQSALGVAMDEPEDLMQLVLGMTSPALFRELFSEAHRVPASSLSGWFDGKTATFGGRDVLDAVRDLVGNCASFDFQQVSPQLPRLDLPALKPFLLLMLAINRRRPREEDGRLSFRTPDAWLDEAGVASEYDGLVFDRAPRERDAAKKVVGVGHKAFDRAVRQALAFKAAIAVIPDDELRHPLLVFRVSDRVTTERGHARAVVFGIARDDQGLRLRKDFELIDELNGFNVNRLARAKVPVPAVGPDVVLEAASAAEAFLNDHLPATDLKFKVPLTELIAVLWPGRAESAAAADAAADAESEYE
jgi:hypothetical protein